MPRIKCAHCLKPKNYCYCEQINICDNEWPVWILQHPNEAGHAIGTANIAHLSLRQSQLGIAKKLSDDLNFIRQVQSQKPLLVFPSENSVTLDSIDLSSPRPILFIDATWRKAKRMLLESPQLNELTHVRLVEPVKPRYKIRKVPTFKKNTENKESERFSGLSTLEAIVYTLRSLENKPQKYQSLLDTMDWVIQRQIDAMGKDTFYKNYINKNN